MYVQACVERTYVGVHARVIGRNGLLRRCIDYEQQFDNQLTLLQNLFLYGFVTRIYGFTYATTSNEQSMSGQRDHNIMASVNSKCGTARCA